MGLNIDMKHVFKTIENLVENSMLRKNILEQEWIKTDLN